MEALSGSFVVLPLGQAFIGKTDSAPLKVVIDVFVRVDVSDCPGSEKVLPPHIKVRCLFGLHPFIFCLLGPVVFKIPIRKLSGFVAKADRFRNPLQFLSRVFGEIMIGDDGGLEVVRRKEIADILILF